MDHIVFIIGFIVVWMGVGIGSVIIGLMLGSDRPAMSLDVHAGWLFFGLLQLIGCVPLLIFVTITLLKLG